MSMLRASKQKKKRGFDLDIEVYERLEKFEKNINELGGYVLPIDEKVQATVTRSLDKAEQELKNMKQKATV